MSFLINPYAYGGFTPIDFSGLNLTHIWSVFKTSLATINYCMRVTHISGTGNYRYIFYDSNGEISLNSQVSTTTTADESTTIQDRIDDIGGSPNFHIVDRYCQITGAALSIISGGTPTGMPKIVNSGAIHTDNGKPAIDFFSGSGYFEAGSGFSQLDKGNDFSVSLVYSCDTSAAQQVILSTQDSVSAPNNRFEIYADRSTNKEISNLKEGGTTNFIEFGTQQNNSNQRRVVVTKEDEVEIKGYLDDNLEDTDAISTGAYTNDQLRIGANFSTALDFIGNEQWIGLHDAILTDGGTVSTLDGKLNDYFSF